ncbi:MAG: hypothetical protein AB7S26_15720 [Sandaracinaceae bacterium]
MIDRRLDAAAIALSLLAHAALFAYVLYSTSVPDLPFEFEMPLEVEFGLTEAVEVAEGAEAAATANDPSDPAGTGPGAALDGGVPEDAGPPDAGRRRRREPDPPEVASEDGSGETGDQAGDRPGTGRGVAFLPAGAQIALRLDVARLRESPLAGDVRELLAVLPDWQALLDGSGIDPLDDLDRLLLATPNLQRSRLIIAGRASGDQSTIRQAAARLAVASGQPIEWTTQRGVEVAPWHDRDETERIIALIGPRHFVICRPEDLARVLAVARNRAAEEQPSEPPPEGEEAPAPEHPADALLSMEEGEGLSLEIEGARAYAQASQRAGTAPITMIPTELRLAMRQLPNDVVGARTRWGYEDASQAGGAADYWNQLRTQFAPVAGLLGLGRVLSAATLEAEDDHVDGSVDLQLAEMRQLLNVSRQYMVDRARAREREAARRAAQAGGSAPAPTPPAPTPPGGGTPTEVAPPAPEAPPPPPSPPPGP